jgi:hypothetical protein
MRTTVTRSTGALTRGVSIASIFVGTAETQKIINPAAWRSSAGKSSEIV